MHSPTQYHQNTALATLLKSKKPLPVPVIAQAIAKMVMRTKAILITFRMTPFFMQSHSFIKFKFSVPYKINLLGFTKFLYFFGARKHHKIKKATMNF